MITAALMPIGCSKNPTKVIPPKPISHADADDIAQVLGTTLSADNGGWYFTIKAIAESLSVPPPIISVAGMAPTPGWAVPLTTRLGIQNDYRLTKAAINFDFRTGYVRGDGSITTVRDTASQEFAAYVVGEGTFANANGISGLYGIHPLPLHGAADSSYTVDGLTADTLEFSAFMEDSMYGAVNSTITPNAGRNWYHPANTVDFTLRIPRSKLTTAPYPSAFDSEINWIIEARSLNAAGDREAFDYDLIVEARMTFDGSADGLLIIANVTLEPDWFYLYKVNLNTGTITRMN